MIKHHDITNHIKGQWPINYNWLLHSKNVASNDEFEMVYRHSLAILNHVIKTILHSFSLYIFFKKRCSIEIF
jgi:hypothetical protein